MACSHGGELQRRKKKRRGFVEVGKLHNDVEKVHMLGIEYDRFFEDKLIQ